MLKKILCSLLSSAIILSNSVGFCDEVETNTIVSMGASAIGGIPIGGTTKYTYSASDGAAYAVCYSSNHTPEIYGEFDIWCVAYVSGGYFAPPVQRKSVAYDIDGVHSESFSFSGIRCDDDWCWPVFLQATVSMNVYEGTTGLYGNWGAFVDFDGYNNDYYNKNNYYSQNSTNTSTNNSNSNSSYSTSNKNSYKGTENNDYTGTSNNNYSGTSHGSYDGTSGGNYSGTNTNGNYNGSSNGNYDGITNRSYDGYNNGNYDGSVNGNYNGTYDSNYNGSNNNNYDNSFNSSYDGTFYDNNYNTNSDINGTYNGNINASDFSIDDSAMEMPDTDNYFGSSVDSLSDYKMYNVDTTDLVGGVRYIGNGMDDYSANNMVLDALSNVRQPDYEETEDEFFEAMLAFLNDTKNQASNGGYVEYDSDGNPIYYDKDGNPIKSSDGHSNNMVGNILENFVDSSFLDNFKAPQTISDQEMFGFARKVLKELGYSLEDLMKNKTYDSGSAYTDPDKAWDMNRITTLLKGKKIKLSEDDLKQLNQIKETKQKSALSQAINN